MSIRVLDSALEFVGDTSRTHSFVVQTLDVNKVVGNYEDFRIGEYASFFDDALVQRVIRNLAGDDSHLQKKPEPSVYLERT